MKKPIQWLKKAGLWTLTLALLALGAAFVVAPDWTWNLLISLDQLGNTILGGDPDETISSRLGKWTTGEYNWLRQQVANLVCWFLDFFDANHCVESIDNTRGDHAVIE